MLQKVCEQVEEGQQNWVRSVVVAVAVGIAFFLAAQLGLALLTTAERVAVFWPASGIAAGAVIALGPWARTPVATGVLVATAAANVMADRSLWAALAFGLSNVVEALLASWLIERWFGPTFTLDNLRRVLGFFGAAVVATSTAAVGASSAMKLFGPSTAEFLDVWKVWFPSGALGMITVAPILIGVAAAVRDRPSWRELLEGTLGVVAVTATIWCLLAILSGPWSLVGPASLLFPLLLWLGYRCRPVFAAAALFTISIAIVWTTTHEFGRYGDPAQPIAIRVVAAQIVMLGTALAALALAALFAERHRHEASILASEARLRSTLDALVERKIQLALAGKVGLVGSYAYGTDTEVMQISEGYAAIHGFPEGTAEIARSECLAGVHPDDIGRVQQLRSEAFRERWREYNVEYRIFRAGEVRWVETRCFISYNGEGRPHRVVGVSIDITERKRVDDQQRILLAELDHRVKNVLATVQAVSTHTMETSDSMEDFVGALEGRIRSMGSTHALLSERRWLGIPLGELVERELAPYTTGTNTDIGGPEVMLSAEAGQTIAMVLHELVTNAAKHGALSAQSGRVSVRWLLPVNGNARDRLYLKWRETGGPLVVPASKSSYGTRTIRELIPYELGGTVDHVLAPEGVRCQMDIPLARLTGSSSHVKGPAAASEETKEIRSG